MEARAVYPNPRGTASPEGSDWGWHRYGLADKTAGTSLGRRLHIFGGVWLGGAFCLFNLHKADVDDDSADEGDDGDGDGSDLASPTVTSQLPDPRLGPYKASTALRAPP